MGGLSLTRVPGRFALCRLPAGAPAPPVPDAAGFFALARTPDELSVFCAEADAPAGARVEGGYALLRVAGPMDLALTGVMAALAVPLAAAGVPIMPVATFDTDWLLVPGDRVEDAVAALRGAGHAVG